MGRDKALIPHPEGGNWLMRTLELLARLKAPITLFSRHQNHLELAKSVEIKFANQGVVLDIVVEHPPWQGPLIALNRLMQIYPDQCLLICPVDMPKLNYKVLKHLITEAKPTGIYVAHDGNRSQPLLGIYCSDAVTRTHLNKTVMEGERKLISWLSQIAHKNVQLEQTALVNINRQIELPIQI